MDVSASWQDRANPLFLLTALVRGAHFACCVLQENMYFWSYNNESVVDQACSVKLAGYCPMVFSYFCSWPRKIMLCVLILL